MEKSNNIIINNLHLEIQEYEDLIPKIIKISEL